MHAFIDRLRQASVHSTITACHANGSSSKSSRNCTCNKKLGFFTAVLHKHACFQNLVSPWLVMSCMVTAKGVYPGSVEKAPRAHHEPQSPLTCIHFHVCVACACVLPVHVCKPEDSQHGRTKTLLAECLASMHAWKIS